MGCSQPEALPVISSKKKPVTLEHLNTSLEEHNSEIGKAVMFKNGNFLIWTKELPNTPARISTLAHEIFHTVYNIRTWIGAPYLTEESEEDWAYLISWLTETIFKKYETCKGRG